jgi:hypothetical protein
LLEELLGKKDTLIGAQDSTFMPKVGKSTDGLGYFLEWIGG